MDRRHPTAVNTTFTPVVGEFAESTGPVLCKKT
jgi:hypothetical protein